MSAPGTNAGNEHCDSSVVAAHQMVLVLLLLSLNIPCFLFKAMVKELKSQCFLTDFPFLANILVLIKGEGKKRRLNEN